MNGYQGWPQQRRILIIKWINLFGRYQSVLSLATPVIAQWAREQSHMAGVKKVLWGYSHMHFHSPMLIWLEPTLNVQSVQKTKTSTESFIWHCSLGWSASYLRADWLNLTIPIMKRVKLILTGLNTYSGYGFDFPVCNAAIKTIIHGLREYFIHHPDSLHSIVLTTRIHFTAKELHQWAHTHGIH